MRPDSPSAAGWSSPAVVRTNSAFGFASANHRRGSSPRRFLRQLPVHRAGFSRRHDGGTAVVRPRRDEITADPRGGAV